jgi:hypothetical protein
MVCIMSSLSTLAEAIFSDSGAGSERASWDQRQLKGLRRRPRRSRFRRLVLYKCIG